VLGGPSLLAAIGEFLIDHQPPGAKDLVVSLFGTNDKLALETLIVTLALVVGAGLGALAATRSFGAAGAVVAAFAAAGFLAAIGSPATSLTSAMIVALVAAITGIQTLSWLLAAAGRPLARGGKSRAAAPDWSRRSFVLQAGAIAVASSVA